MSVVVERREQVLQLRREGLTYREIAERMGLSPSYIYGLGAPKRGAAKLLQQSRDAKVRRRGTCTRCGGETRYNGKSVNGPSILCSSCSKAVNGERMIGKGPTVEKLLAYLDAPHTYTEIRLHLGITRGRAGVLLSRHVTTGLIVRLRRGVYQRADLNGNKAA